MTILHILTQPGDDFANGIIQRQQESGKSPVTVFDLREETADYQALLELIFQCDSIQVW